MTVQFNKNVLDLLHKRYFLKDEKGNFLEESWEDVCDRVATNIASAEENRELQEQYKKIFYEKLLNLEIIPSSPCIFNAGTKLQQLSSCFIIDCEDSMESIANRWTEESIIFKSGGGAGFNTSKLRPKGTIVKSSNGQASGVISFMHIDNEVVERIKQGGRRKGALKIDLNDYHPEIIDFIHCKDNEEMLKNMNISVSISDKFMNALLNNENWNLEFNDEIYKTIKATDLWNEIIDSAWKTGEPGISFRDIMDRDNKNPHLGKIVSSNPCQEFINIAYASCILLSIILEKIIHNKRIDYKKLEENIRIAIRFLDNMITVNKLPLDKIESITKAIRPIGLGTIGYANMLYILEIPYNSEEAYKITDELYKFIQKIAIDESVKLAEEKGVYPAWKGSVWEKNGIPIRNCNHISIAPNGSIGFICESTGGIEPEYALVYTRTTNEETKYFVVNKVFKQKLIELGLYSDELLEKISNNNGSIQNIEEIPYDIRRVFVVSHDISPQEHLKTLSIVQKYVDLAISKTVNMPNNATKEDISNVYIEAWKNGIKGITVYRDGSRKNQVLTTKASYHDFTNYQDIPRGFVIDTPDDTTGKRRKIYTGCGTLYVKVFYDEITGEILETFLSKGSTGGCERFMQFSSRLMSRLLRIGDTAEGIADQAFSVGACPSYMYAKGKGIKLSKGKNCPSAIAYTLLEIQKEIKEELGLDELPKFNKEVKITYVEKEEDINKCPECGEKLRYVEGCNSCANCGYSKCN